MVLLGPGEAVLGPAFGASTLTRDADGVTGTVHLGDLGTKTSVLDDHKAAVYSVWGLFFDNPGACLETAGICGPTEERTRDGGVAAGLSIFRIAGGIASPPVPGTPKCFISCEQGRPS